MPGILDDNQRSASSSPPIPSIHHEVNPFDMELLMNTITNTDILIRDIKQKTDENVRLRNDLQSLKESASQLQKVYYSEKEKCAQLTSDNDRMDVKLKQLESEVGQMKHDRLNAEKIHEQEVAELQHKLEKSETKAHNEYTQLCKLFLLQETVLRENNLSAAEARKKSFLVRDFLKRNGHPVEDVPRRSSSTSKNNAKISTTLAVSTSTGTMTDAATDRTTMSVSTSTGTMTDAATDPTKPSVCDKSTSCSKSTATRSTSTTAFIKQIDASTMTDLDAGQTITDIFSQLIPMPKMLSPIQEFETTPETESKTFTSVGTMTRIRNIRSRVSYAKDVGCRENCPNYASRREIKKEKDISPFGSMSNLFLSSKAMARNLGADSTISNVDPVLSGMWRIMGDLIFTAIGNGKASNEEKTDNDVLTRILEFHKLLNESNITVENRFEDDASEALISTASCEYGNFVSISGETQPQRVPVPVMETPSTNSGHQSSQSVGVQEVFRRPLDKPLRRKQQKHTSFDHRSLAPPPTTSSNIILESSPRRKRKSSSSPNFKTPSEVSNWATHSQSRELIGFSCISDEIEAKQNVIIVRGRAHSQSGYY